MQIIKFILIFILGMSIGQFNDFLGYSLIFILLAFYTRKDLINDIKHLKISRKNLITICSIFSATILLILGLNYLLTIFTNESINNLIIKENVISKPLYYFCIVTLLVPFDEEILIRYGFKFIKNKYAYIIISSLIYAILHLRSINEILFLIPYFLLGVSFSYSYTKTRNIMYPIILHIIYNTIAFILVLI